MKGPRNRLLVALTLGLALRMSGTHEVFVWQRQFGPEVVESLRKFQPQLHGCCVLAGEISWAAGRMQVARPAIDFTALVALRKPVGLALRIGTYAGAFAGDDATARAIAETAAGLIKQASAAGLAVAELQIDFDAAESKLAGYRSWLGALRGRIGATPLVVTALPAWLKHEDFRALVRAADGFVLQVHSLEKPAGPEAAFSLCDPERALAWAKQASAVGVPFRVALPTYGYMLAFDASGKFIAVAAEGPQRSWPIGTRLRVVRSDAVAMARLSRVLEAEPPPHCRGVIWFRLPVASDRHNWDAITFAAVLRGEAPQRNVCVRAAWSENGLAEIVMSNDGQTTEPLPATLRLTWPAGERLMASDGLAGFVLEIRAGEAQGIIRAADVPADASLAPGRNATIAWLRFAREISLDVTWSLPP